MTMTGTARSANLVTVSAEATLLQTENAVVGQVVDNRYTTQIPLNGRDFTQLLRLTPGYNDAGSMNGARSNQNNWQIDGVDNNDASITGPAANVIQDAIEEFSLLQNNFNAEFGAGAGGQFNTITKSGTNSFHGRAFTYINSQQFNAHSTLEDGRDKDFFKQVRWGGAMGGPIVKNKLFFFGAYERYYLAQPGAVDNYFAPTAEGLNQIGALPGVSPFVVDLRGPPLPLAPAPVKVRFSTLPMAASE